MPTPNHTQDFIERFSIKMACPSPTLSELIANAVNLHEKTYGSKPDVCVSAPGRVNLIGEHLDYNDGYVFPMALPLVTLIVGKKAEHGKYSLVTDAEHADEPKRIELEKPSHNSPLTPGRPNWFNYVKGVLANFHDKICPFDATIVHSVPVGGGLSSSASLEVAMYTFLEELTGSRADKVSKGLACQKAENEFANMPCGIMDQFASIFSEPHHALLLDCRSKEITLVPMVDPSLKVVIINSNVRHELTGSEFGTRKRQCEDAAKILGKKKLRDVSLKELEDSKELLGEELYKRAHHVVTEIKRTTDAATALKNSDYKLFGKLMKESHISLRDDYQVSCKEVDQLVEMAWEVNGVYGSRMTGGGFGGCTVTLVKDSSVQDLINHTQKHYDGTATFYICEPAGGAHVLSLNNKL